MDSLPLPAVAGAVSEAGPGRRPWWQSLGFLRTLRERLCAARLCRALRASYLRVRAYHPHLEGAALYEHLVQHHLGVTAEEAGRVVGLVAESFASWPAPRPVTFRDVAHYLASTELMAGGGWVTADVREVINRRLPAGW